MFKRLLGLVALLALLAACTPSGPAAVRATLSPAAGATGVPVDSEITARFNVAMNTSTLTNAFSLSSEDGPVAGTFEYSVEQRRATFVPDTQLEYETTYTASIADTVRSAEGGRLTGASGGALSWSFTTEEAPDEVPAVTTVAVNPPAAAVIVGDDIQLEAVVTAEGGASTDVTWESSDEALATVDADGLVTTLALGEVEITATSVFNNTVSGSAIITIVDAPAVVSITVTPATAALELDGSQQLEANVVAVGGAEETVTWASSDEDVATVDEDGLVTAVSAGVATVTATSTFDDTVYGSAEITVLPEAVLSVTVDPADATLEAGDEEQLTATVETQSGASDAVTWTSSDNAIATVDADGLVTAVAPGTATVTATSDFDDTVSGSATINVAGVTEISVSPETASLIVGATEQLTAGVTALHGADDSVTWTSDDEAVATVDADGLVTAVSAGTAVITATSNYDETVEGVANVTVVDVLTADDYAADAGYVSGQAFTIAAPAVSGGATPYDYELTGGSLPEGVALNADGSISGTATELGDFSGTVTVSDGSGQTSEADFEFAVAAPLAAIIYSGSTFTVGEEATTIVLVTSGGLAPFTFTEVTIDPDDPEWADRFAPDGGWYDHDIADQGPLAPGLTIGEDGQITGTPTTAGYFRTYIHTVDAVGQEEYTQLEILVNAP